MFEGLNLSEISFLSASALLHYLIGYVFGHIFPLKSDYWSKMQPIVGFVIILIVVVATYKS